MQQLNMLLWMPHLLLEDPSESLLLQFRYSFLWMYILGGSWWCLKSLYSCHPHLRQYISKILALPWSSPGCCQHVGNEPVDEKSVFSFFFSFPPSAVSPCFSEIRKVIFTSSLLLGISWWQPRLGGKVWALPGPPSMCLHSPIGLWQLFKSKLYMLWSLCTTSLSKGLPLNSKMQIMFLENHQN